MNNRKTLLSFVIGVITAFSVAAVTWTPGTGNFSVRTGATNSVTEPALISTTSNTVAFEATVSSGGPENVRLRLLQNVGTVPVLYRLGGTASASAYHGVLAPCSTARDGLGSVVNLTAWRGSVSIAVESGTGVVSTVEIVQ